MASHQNPCATTCAHSCVQFPPQPYIAPGLSYPDNTKFLGVFTASHFSICLLVSGFGLIVTGLLGVVTRASLDQNAFHAVGIALICFGAVLIIIAISIFVFAIRWGRKRVNVLQRPNPSLCGGIPVAQVPIGYSFPVFANPNCSQNNNNFDNLQNGSNFMTAIGNQSFYPMSVPNNSQTIPQQVVVIRPSAPPQSAGSAN